MLYSVPGSRPLRRAIPLLDASLVEVVPSTVYRNLVPEVYISVLVF